ncbi:MAG: DUF4430 domain-containing protein [Clostridia bacterium]|nr:DUF4430 domain-containing protein [Clostridia bacterium]
MKKNVLSALLLLAILALSLVSCGVSREGLWEDATYTSDRTIGEGDTTFYLEVIAGEESVTFTLKTDEKILGEALRDSGIVEGEESTFGLYIKRVNGILADYDTDGSWWGFSIDGESSLVGVDGVEIKSGAHYELTYSK